MEEANGSRVKDRQKEDTELQKELAELKSELQAALQEVGISKQEVIAMRPLFQFSGIILLFISEVYCLKFCTGMPICAPQSRNTQIFRNGFWGISELLTLC